MTKVLANNDHADGAEPAVTWVRPIAVREGRTLAKVEISGGFTHQIRAQAAAHGHSLMGDAKYGGSRGAGGYILHAFEYAVPDAGFDVLRVRAPLSEPARRVVESIFGKETVRREGI